MDFAITKMGPNGKVTIPVNMRDELKKLGTLIIIKKAGGLILRKAKKTDFAKNAKLMSKFLSLQGSPKKKSIQNIDDKKMKESASSDILKALKERFE